jgi:radical SAM superfamily enzyme YgiQ (UPF0313 family)
MNILLLYPRTPDTFWSFRHVVRFMAKKAAFPPVGLLTVAAMMPWEWNYRFIDTNVSTLRDRDIEWADYVLISGMIVHRASVHDLVARCRRHGRPVIAGGPLFTTGHEAFPDISHFVLGEAEDVIAQLVNDLRFGRLRRIYQAEGRPDVTRTPAPRWDLVDLRRYATMAAQFSRGCPFDCEFCDIIVMNGRSPRTKSPAQLLAELDLLRALGWKDSVFIVDDNFIGNKRRTKELLHELITWRKRTKTRMGFLTEASLNLADDPELIALMIEAGFKKVFLGIETPSQEALGECGKVQNTRRDMVESVRILQNSGLEVMGGFIVGFDSDQLDIFRRQFEFIQKSGVVTAMVGLLTALPQTRLHRRLTEEGRIETDATGNNTEAVFNFTPRLNRDFLVNGYRDLMKRLYEPGAYYRRIRTFLEHHRPSGPGLRLSRADTIAFLRSFWVLGMRHKGRRQYWWFFWGILLRRPRQFRHAIELAIMGHHFRTVARNL